MKIAVCQMEVIQGDQNANRASAEWMIQEAAGKGSQVVVLPEMWTCGYDFTRLAEHKEPLEGPTYEFLSGLAEQHKIWIIGGSYPIQFGDGVRNTSLTFDPHGNLQNTYSKVHLIGLMEEDRYLVPGNESTVFEIEDHLSSVEICYDIRFPELARTIALAGAKILFIPAQFPIQREDHWITLLRARAIENQFFVVGVNMSGENESDVFNGHSMVLDPWGVTIAAAESEPTILYSDVDLSMVDSIREKIPVFRDRRPSAYNIYGID